MSNPNPPRIRCRATAKHTGNQCANTAVAGGLVCHKHGGSAPQVKAKAAARVAEHQARLAAEKLAVPIDTTPEQALIDEVKRAAGMVAFYQARIEEIDADDRDSLVWGKTKEDHSGEFPGPIYEATPNVWLQLWNQERDRLTRVATAAIKAGIEERRVKLAESEGVLVAAALRRILDQMLIAVLEVTPAAPDAITTVWVEMVNQVVPRELRALSAV